MHLKMVKGLSKSILYVHSKMTKQKQGKIQNYITQRLCKVTLRVVHLLTQHMRELTGTIVNKPVRTASEVMRKGYLTKNNNAIRL